MNYNRNVKLRDVSLSKCLSVTDALRLMEHCGSANFGFLHNTLWVKELKLHFWHFFDMLSIQKSNPSIKTREKQNPGPFLPLRDRRQEESSENKTKKQKLCPPFFINIGVISRIDSLENHFFSLRVNLANHKGLVNSYFTSCFKFSGASSLNLNAEMHLIHRNCFPFSSEPSTDILTSTLRMVRGE